MRQLKTLFQCHQCNKYMSSRASLLCHVRSHIKTTEPSRINYSQDCGSVPVSKKDIFQIDTRQSSTSVDEVRNGQQETSMNENAWEFNESESESQDTIYCTLCDEIFSSIVTLKVHVNSTHKQQKRLQQKQESEEEEKQQEFQNEKQHEEKVKKAKDEFRCPICSKIVYFRRGLKIHMARIHYQIMKDANPTKKESSPPPVEISRSSCRYCVKSFKSDRSLKQHMFYKHKDHYDRNKTALQGSSKDKKIVKRSSTTESLLACNYSSSFTNKRAASTVLPMSSSSPATVNSSNGPPVIKAISSRDSIISKSWAAKAFQGPIRQKNRPQHKDTEKTLMTWKEFSSPSRYSAAAAISDNVTDVSIRNSAVTQANPLLTNELIVCCPICQQVFCGVPFLILHLQKQH